MGLDQEKYAIFEHYYSSSLIRGAINNLDYYRHVKNPDEKKELLDNLYTQFELLKTEIEKLKREVR